MLNQREIFETHTRSTAEFLDIRTITLGICCATGARRREIVAQRFTIRLRTRGTSGFWFAATSSARWHPHRQQVCISRPYAGAEASDTTDMCRLP